MLHLSYTKMWLTLKGPHWVLKKGQSLQFLACNNLQEFKFYWSVENSVPLYYSVVCYEHNRDEIRSRLIGWLKNHDKSLEGVEGYRNLLKSYFDLVDENNDGKLDATEFREFIQANQSTDEVQYPCLLVCFPNRIETWSRNGGGGEERMGEKIVSEARWASG